MKHRAGDKAKHCFSTQADVAMHRTEKEKSIKILRKVG
jgi:hypothetical protein